MAVVVAFAGRRGELLVGRAVFPAPAGRRTWQSETKKIDNWIGATS
jgi:hypothetical protein